MAINPALLDLAKLASVIPSQTTVDPGDLVSAVLTFSLPGDNPAMDGFASTL